MSVEHFLRAFDGEGGNDDLFAIAVAVGDGFSQFVAAEAWVFVVAVAIGGLEKEIVRRGGLLRVVDDEGVGPAEVAREDEPCGSAVFRDFKFEERRTEDVPRVLVCHTDAGRRFERVAIVHRTQHLGRPGGVFGRIERFDLLDAPVAGEFAALPFRFHLLDVRAVLQHDAKQVGCGFCAVYGAGEPVARHGGQQPRMVNMRVGDQKEGYVGWTIDLGIIVTLFDFGVALMHAAVDGEAQQSSSSSRKTTS